MSNRSTSPDDEPVIGLARRTDGAVEYDDLVIDFDAPPGTPGRVHRAEPGPYPYAEDDLDPYYERYLEDSPTRSPWFYAFLVAAAAIGAVIVFAIVRSIDTGDDDPTATPAAAQILQVGLSSPREGDRVVAGEEMTFAATVASSSEITKVELLIDDRPYATGSASPKQSTVSTTPGTEPPARLYDAVVRARFSERGDHRAALRITAGGQVRDSESIYIFVVEPAGDPRVEARVIATTAVRSGPSELFPEVDRLQPGATIRIAAKTRDNEWLLLDIDSPGERWVRRNAVQEAASLATLPVRDSTGTPPPATPTPAAEVTRTPGDGLPDFAPGDVRFAFGAGGRAVLRVTITNRGAAFSGPLTVETTMSSGRLVSNQIVVDLTLKSQGGSATVDFEVAGAIPGRADVTVRIDAANTVRESNEDNNGVTFPGVAAPADPPEVRIADVSVQGTTVSVRVHNLGGPLGESDITVRVTIGGQTISQTVRRGLGTDQAATFDVQAPATGTGTVEVLIAGAVSDSRAVEVTGESSTRTPTLPSGSPSASPSASPGGNNGTATPTQ